MLLAVYLIFLGVCLGSFVNALVWRTPQRELANRKQVTGNKEQETKAKAKKSSSQFPVPSSNLSILHGRSMCPNCKHQLAAMDLMPVLSWLFLRGRCRYCKRPISPQYPIIEAAQGLVFLFSYIFWPQTLHGGQIVLFVTWLACSVGLIALLVYDLKWMLLPNSILYPTFFLAAAGEIIYLVGYAPHKLHALTAWILSLAVASGIFWLLYYASKGEWIGFGDVRLGLITGTLLRTPGKSFLMVFLASLLGIVVILPLITLGKRRLSTHIPYGPFLITATFIGVLFGASLIDWYKALVGL